MRCAWQALLNIIPLWMRETVDKKGRDGLQELRLRFQLPPEMLVSGEPVFLSGTVQREDLSFCINASSRYSPWAASTVSQGFVTAQGGHRVGICGDAVVQDGSMKGINLPGSLCIRVARDFPGIAEKLRNIKGSLLVIGAPGSGKTTLLRDIIRQKSESACVAVVDERCELFPRYGDSPCFFTGNRTDILTGCKKTQGIQFVLRTMSPQIIAVDEITEAEDADALHYAGWCGVSLLASAHAESMTDLYQRPVYRSIVEDKLFDWVVVLNKDKSWRLERMD